MIGRAAVFWWILTATICVAARETEGNGNKCEGVCKSTPKEQWEARAQCASKLQSAITRQDEDDYETAVEELLEKCVPKRSVYYARNAADPVLGVEIGHATYTHEQRRVNIDMDTFLREKILVQEGPKVRPGVRILVGGMKPADFFSDASTLDRLATRNGMAMIKFSGDEITGEPCARYLRNLRALRDLVARFPNDVIVIDENMACEEDRGIDLEFWSGEVVVQAKGAVRYIVRARKTLSSQEDGDGDYLKSVQNVRFFSGNVWERIASKLADWSELIYNRLFDSAANLFVPRQYQELSLLS